MKQTQSYTSNLIETMMNSYIEQKLSRGFTKLSNGLFEDCTGQIFTVDLKQSKEVVDTDGVMYSVEIKMLPVNVAGGL